MPMQETSSPDIVLRTWYEGSFQHVPLNILVVKKKGGEKAYHFTFIINLHDQFWIKDMLLRYHYINLDIMWISGEKHLGLFFVPFFFFFPFAIMFSAIKEKCFSTERKHRGRHLFGLQELAREAVFLTGQKQLA